MKIHKNQRGTIMMFFESGSTRLDFLVSFCYRMSLIDFCLQTGFGIKNQCDNTIPDRRDKTGLLLYKK